MIYNDCEKELEGKDINCPLPGAMAGLDTQTSAPAQPETSIPQAVPLTRAIDMGSIIILTGAIMMLIGLFIDLYTVCIPFAAHVITPLDSYIYVNLDFAELKIELLMLGLHGSGTILPLVLLFVFPSLAILCVIYSLTTGKRFKNLWRLLSLLSIAALVANFLYLLVIFILDINIYFVIPQTGWVLALIGAAAIGIGSTHKSRRRIAVAPRAVSMGFLSIFAGAIMMLISLTLGWYSMYTAGGGWAGSAGFGLLVRWPVLSLPIIAIIVIASLSVIYSLATGQYLKRFWIGISLLAAALLIVNLIAILRWGWISDSFYALPRAGWFLALAGAGAIGMGGWMMKKKSPQEG